MKKTEKAALLLQSFPEIPKADLLECQRLAPHFMLYRSDLSSARCGACGKTLTDYDYDDFLFVLEHKKDIVCPECGRKVTAVCDKYRYSVEVERYAQNFVIFQAGDNGTCYAHCVRIQVNLHKEIGEPHRRSHGTRKHSAMRSQTVNATASGATASISSFRSIRAPIHSMRGQGFQNGSTARE